MLNRENPIPLYLQIAEELRQKIRSGEIRGGDKLPSESEMTAAYGVGHLTVRNALKKLVEEGYLEKAQGKGTFCRSTAPGQIRNVEVILDMENVYFVPYYVRGISSVLQEHNCKFLINSSGSNPAEICDLLERILQEDPAGVILQMMPTNLTEETRARLERNLQSFLRRRIPLIMIDSHLDGDGYSYCIVDEAGGGARAAEHLSAYGHKRCAVVYHTDFCDAVKRYEGFAAAAGQFAMEPPVPILSDHDLEKNLPDLIKKRQITGIFCYNDAVAQQCIQCLRAEGFDIPGDVSVIGFDDSYLAPATEPPLTTISHPKEALGRHTAKALLRLMQDGPLPPCQEVFDVRLIQRSSCSLCNP